MAETKFTLGGLLLIHPSGDAIICKRGDGNLARALILDGYEPIGPRGKGAAKIIRERAAKARGETP